MLRTVSPFEAAERLLSDPRHVLVCGITGAGKTTFIARVLIPAALRRNYSIVIIDMDGEYAAFNSAPVIPLPVDTLPSVVARMVAASSETTGSATFLALHRALLGGVIEVGRNIVQLEPPDSLAKLLVNLEVLARVYGYANGALAALSRLLPLADCAELVSPEILEGVIEPRGVLRFDLSGIRDEYSRATAAALIVSALGEALGTVEKVLVVAEEAQRYWEASGGLFIEQTGRRRKWKAVRVEQSVPEDAHNYNVVIGNMGIDRERFFLDTRFPARIKELGDMEFLVYVVGENKWYKTELAPLLRLEEPRLARVKRGIKQVKQKIKVRKRGR